MAAAKLVFFGNERLATGVTTNTPVLHGLIGAGYDIAAVVTAQNEVGKSRKGRGLEITAAAEAYGIPVISPPKLHDATDDIKKFAAEAAILVAYGKIVPQAVIDSFPQGIINIHPSLLPKHRGSIPLESVLLNGETETGVSLMQLAAKMDAGPVFVQQKLSLEADETKQALAARLGELGRDMLLSALPGILDGSLSPKDQNNDDASYDERITKEDGVLDFHKPAARLVNEVRAYSGWPRSRTTIGTTEVVIVQAHQAQGTGTPGTLWLDDKQLGIRTASGILVIDKLIPAGKQVMTAEAFLAGYHP